MSHRVYPWGDSERQLLERVKRRSLAESRSMASILDETARSYGFDDHHSAHQQSVSMDSIRWAWTSTTPEYIARADELLAEFREVLDYGVNGEHPHLLIDPETAACRIELLSTSKQALSQGLIVIELPAPLYQSRVLDIAERISATPPLREQIRAAARGRDQNPDQWRALQERVRALVLSSLKRTGQLSPGSAYIPATQFPVALDSQTWAPAQFRRWQLDQDSFEAEFYFWGIACSVWLPIWEPLTARAQEFVEQYLHRSAAMRRVSLRRLNMPRVMDSLMWRLRAMACRTLSYETWAAFAKPWVARAPRYELRYHLDDSGLSDATHLSEFFLEETEALGRKRQLDQARARKVELCRFDFSSGPVILQP